MLLTKELIVVDMVGSKEPNYLGHGNIKFPSFQSVLLCTESPRKAFGNFVCCQQIYSGLAFNRFTAVINCFVWECSWCCVAAEQL